MTYLDPSYKLLRKKMISRITFIFTVALLFYSTAYAQINTEKYRPLVDTSGFTAITKFDILIYTGNKDLQEFNLEGNFDYRWDDFYTFLVYQGEYGWQGGEEFSNEMLGHFRFVNRLSDWLRVETYFQSDFNKSRLLNFRYLVGSGFRLKIFNGASSNSSFGTGYMYENEKLDLEKTASHPAHTSVHRWTNYLTYQLKAREGVYISSVIYYQPQFDDFNDYRVLNESSLLVSLGSHFSLSVAFILRYDSKPPDTINELDTKSRIGFVVRY